MTLERFNQFSFFELGRVLFALTRHEGDVAPHLIVWELWDARGMLEDLLEGAFIPIGISRAKGQELLDTLNAIEDEYMSSADEQGERTFKFPEPKDRPIPDWRWQSFKRVFADFETIFREEMRETATYYVPRRGIFHIPALVDSADEHFPFELLPFIPDKARVDWKAAGRCLAFNLLSASGFHTARAVEAMLECYYQLFCGCPGKTLNGWADYKAALDKVIKAGSDPAPREKTLAELDQMRVDYRNPIVHPRVVLSEADARMLFANGESLIIAMAQEVAEAKAAGVQTSFALVGGSDASGT